MNALEQYGQEAARVIGLQAAEFPTGEARRQFLFEVLENLSPGLYARTILSANAANQKGVPMGQAVYAAIASGLVQAVAKQAVQDGTPPIALEGLFGSIGSAIGKVAAAPIKLVGAITKPVISSVAKLVSGTLTAATCPIVSTPAGQVAVVGAAAYYSGGTAAGAAGVGAQGMAAACNKTPAQAAPQTALQQVGSAAQKFILPAAVIGGGLLIWTLLKR